MEYARYKKLKSSGIAWLRDTPSHWRIKRLKFVTDLVNNKVSAEDSTLPYLGLEHIESWTGRRIDGEIYNSEGLASRFSIGDVLFGKLRPYLAKIHLAQQDGLISSEALVIRSKTGLNSEFLKYYMLSRDFINIVDSSTYGSKMPKAGWDFIGNLPVLLPEIDEQQAIVHFLDFKTAQIDALIAKKQALLEKLAEKRTALISHAVTKGLDPSAPMKDSGVEWLGKIPTHWETKKGRRIGNLLGSITPSEDDILDEGGIAFAKVDDINTLNHDLTLTKTKTRISDTYSFINKRILLFPKRGAAIFTNKVAIAGPRITFDSNLMGWDIMEQCNIKFIAYCLLARRLDDLADVSTVPQINNKHIYPAIFPSPPLREQTAIATYLDNETTILEALAVKISLAIKCLQEYRSALITNAVTGKIDVRGCQVPEEIA